MAMPEILEKTYDPKEIEAEWYPFWSQKGFFRPERHTGGVPYCITIPPPNVTGELHMGHALQHTIHDTVVRWKRMQGYSTLCLPGTDHAGIATQMKVEQQLYEEEKKIRHDFGREKMLKRIWEWQNKYGNTILGQLREMGCSYDWPRERFTMDKEYSRAVLEAFVRFYQKGWIYRGKRMVNWCPQCGTVISDLEVEEKEIQGFLWHIRYQGKEGGPSVVVATTRPETMLGDTAVAVHPEDKRWRKAIGGKVILPLVKRSIPIIGDEYADPKLGSGAVKVTPVHDPNDYEVGLRHNLPEIQVIGFGGKMTQAAGQFENMDRYACRKAVVKALQKLDLIEKIEDYFHAVPCHDRCGVVIEPLPMEQWFVAMKELANKALPKLRQEKITFVPNRFRLHSIEWLENIQDWCISRQIWWGHRIPVWTCQACSELAVQVDLPQECESCGCKDLEQDPDVLDTWFSSALWPFATLGWPKETKELEIFHPTDLMITGRDILYLWVARMIMIDLEFLGQIPFRTVLVHPTVQTRDGQRMSKSLGTGIDPRELIKRYGADATRLSLLYQCGSSQDIRFDAEIVDNHLETSSITESCRNFCNKIWNASRFVQMHLEDQDFQNVTLLDLPEVLEDLADRWILSRFNRVIRQVSEALEAYRFDEASRTLYEFIWNAYCDWYLEIAKIRLNSSDTKARQVVKSVLVHLLEGIFRLLHPMAPFISEKLWQRFPHRGDALIVATWPKVDLERLDDVAEQDMKMFQDVVGAVRNIRGTMGVPPNRPSTLFLKTSSEGSQQVLEKVREYIYEFTKANELQVGMDLNRPPGSASAVLKDVEIFVPLKGLIDLSLERQRLEKRIKGLEKAIIGIDRKLENEGFLKNAPKEVIENERQRRTEYLDTLEKLKENLKILKS